MLLSRPYSFRFCASTRSRAVEAENVKDHDVKRRGLYSQEVYFDKNKNPKAESVC